jgi:hypothetical protein
MLIRTVSPVYNSLTKRKTSAYGARLSLTASFQSIELHMYSKSLLQKLQQQYEDSRDAEDSLIMTINERLSSLMNTRTLRQKKNGFMPYLSGIMKSRDSSDREMVRWFKQHSRKIEHKISVVGVNFSQTDFSVND